MNKPATRITEIINGLECKNTPLDENQIYGGPLMEEIMKLTALTLGFYQAEKNGLTYSPAYPAVRTQAGLRELMEFACKDYTRPHIIVFCKTMLETATSEHSLAMSSFGAYIGAYQRLQQSGSWTLPTPAEIAMAVRMSSGLGRPSPQGPQSAAAKPKN